MVEVISFQQAREAQRATRFQQSAFWNLVNDQLREDLNLKKELLHSLGNQAAALREVVAEPGHGSDHVMILFPGAGPLEGHSFAFVVRDVCDRNAVQAEILAVENGTSEVLSKPLSEVPTWNYTFKWLNQCYAAAMELLAPEQEQARLRGCARA